MHSGKGEVEPQDVDQRAKALALARGARVLRSLTIWGKSAYVTHADALRIVTPTVCAYLRQGATRMDGAIEIDDVVITHVGKPLFAMPTTYVIDCDVTTLCSGRAVYDDFFDVSHDLLKY